MRRLLVALALVACSKTDKATSKGSGTEIKSRALADVELALPDGWTKTYEPDSDAWQLASADAKTMVRVERADERFVASPDAYMHHIAPRWKPKLVTIEERKNVKSGFAMMLGIFASENDPNPLHATVVVRELGGAWYRCLSEGTDDEGIREQIIAVCRSVRL
jgi:hypothetical protein